MRDRSARPRHAHQADCAVAASRASPCTRPRVLNVRFPRCTPSGRLSQHQADMLTVSPSVRNIWCISGAGLRRVGDRRECDAGDERLPADVTRRCSRTGTFVSTAGVPTPPNRGVRSPRRLNPGVVLSPSLDLRPTPCHRWPLAVPVAARPVGRPPSRVRAEIRPAPPCWVASGSPSSGDERMPPSACASAAHLIPGAPLPGDARIAERVCRAGGGCAL